MLFIFALNLFEYGECFGSDNAASAVGVRNAYATTYLGLAIRLFILYS